MPGVPSRQTLVALLVGLPVAVAAARADGNGPRRDAEGSAKPLVEVQLLAINDFHGHLQPPTGANATVLARDDDPIARGEGVRIDDAAHTALVPTGGAAYLAAHVARLRSENPNTVLVSSGDLTGASPLLSSVFKDEPTVLVMNQMGLDFEGVGNHDFDRGAPELARLQRGDGLFEGARFQYLAANVASAETKETVFPPYAIRDVAGVRIAFVGMTLKETPSVTVAKNVAGLAFESEAQTVNALVPELKSKGASAIVVLLHQGGTQATGGTYDSCVGLGGDVLPVLRGLDAAIDVVASAHTHQAYDCTIDGRLVTSAASFGRLVTKIDLTIDPAAKRVVSKKARNVPVTRDVAPDAEIASIIASYEAKAAPLARRVVGYVGGDLTANAKAARSASCESPLGDVVADAQLAATKDPTAGGADLAFVNPGGIRADLVAKGSDKADGTVTYAEAFAAQPFSNNMVTQTLTGAQILAILDQQFLHVKPIILAASSNVAFRYTWDGATGTGGVDRASVTLDGTPIDPAGKYRVAANAFLAAGGDGFSVFREGTERVSGVVDLDAFVAYLGRTTTASPLALPPLARVSGNGCAP
jgi:5'-nucleotidase